MNKKRKVRFHNGIPELYHARLTVNNYYHWGYLYHGVDIELVRVPGEQKTFSREDFKKMIVDDNLSDEEIEILETQIEELFTNEEIEMMELYFAYQDSWDTFLKSTKMHFPLKKNDIYPREDLYTQNYKDAAIYSFSLEDHYPINLKIAAYCWHPHWKPYSISSEEAIDRIYKTIKEADRRERNKIINEIRRTTRNNKVCNNFIENKFKSKDEKLCEDLKKIF